MDYTKAVSYTHLDVYKRQPLLSFVRHEIEDYQRFIAQSKKDALNKHQLLLRTPGYIAELSDRPWKNDLNLLIVFPDDGRRCV